MPLQTIRGEDAPIDPLRGRRVAVAGFGNQGHAHALNLRDSGIDVVVANRRDSPNGRRAIECGFDPRPMAEAVRDADLVILALPDEALPEAHDSIRSHLKPGAILGLLHGFAIRYGLLDPDPGLGVIMVAPKGPGTALRTEFLAGRGLLCLFAVHRDSSGGDAEALGLAWASGIGCARAGILPTTFADETETDLFGEQSVLCGGMIALMRAAFDTLTEAGYPPELAYLECCHEVKQIADLVFARGPAGAFQAISRTAEFGAYRAGEFLIDASVRSRMRRLLAEIRDGTFAAGLRRDFEGGFPWFHGRRAAAGRHPIEPAGAAIRELMTPA